MKSRFICGGGCTGGCILITEAAEANGEEEDEKIKNNPAPGRPGLFLPPAALRVTYWKQVIFSMDSFYSPLIIFHCCSRRKNQTIRWFAGMFMVSQRKGKLQNSTKLYMPCICQIQNCVCVCVWGPQEKKQKGDGDKRTNALKKRKKFSKQWTHGAVKKKKKCKWAQLTGAAVFMLSVK